MNTYLGVDLGTSSCRVLACDEDGRIRASARQPMPAASGSNGMREQHAGIWWQVFRDALIELAGQIDLSHARALAIDGTSASLLLTDARGAPCGPALMYNDSQSREPARRIADIAPPDSAAHGASSALAKLMLLGGRYPDAEHALHQADWLAAQLTGRPGQSDENNALKLGYDPINRRWPEWLVELGVARGVLPEVVAPGTSLGPVDAAVARQLSLPEGLRIVAGTTDSVAAFIASGAHQQGDAVTSLGSTLVLKVVSKVPIFAPQFGIYSHRLGDLWLAGGASNSGGAVLRQFFNEDQLRRLTEQLDPAHDSGLDYYPLPAPGERFPIADAQMAPRMQPRPADDGEFFHALLEGMARIETGGYRRLAELGAPYPGRVLSAGGGAANPGWGIMRSRILGVPVARAPQEEAAYGAALLAKQGFNT